MTRLLGFILLVPAAFLLLAWTHLGVYEDARLDREQADELTFSHQYHIEEEELECGDCHDVEESTTGLDNLLPSMEVCSDCHEVEEPDECGMCHTNVDDAREVPRIDTYSVKFSHQKHLDNDLDCANCHAAVAQKAVVEPFILPTMVACVGCHEDRGVVQECATCHLPDERLRPLSHAPNFTHTHGDLARHDALTIDAEKTCQTCHSDDFCQDCHEGDNLDRLTHPLNFAFTHALEAQANEKTCVTCHTEPLFCIDCHRDNQVLPHTHTAGWANTLDGGRHRLEALSDLSSCISCHEDDADRVCQPCHGGFN